MVNRFTCLLNKKKTIYIVRVERYISRMLIKLLNNKSNNCGPHGNGDVASMLTNWYAEVSNNLEHPFSFFSM
jgi:hypothetical protein